MRPLKQTRRLLRCIIIISIVVLFFQADGPGNSAKFKQNAKLVKMLSLTNASDTSKEKELRHRKKVVHEYCQAKGYPPIMPDENIRRIIKSEKYNLSARVIPKVASTFFKQMFSILNNGANYAEKEFQKSRIKIHVQSSNLKATFSKTDLVNTTIIVAVRNPFSRLFSTFVDKIYLPNSVSLIKGVIRYSKQHKSVQRSKSFLSEILGKSQHSNPACRQHKVSFNDFISYVLNSTTVVMKNHYNPCFSLLKQLICNTDSYVLVKQESFADDIQYVLQKVRLHEKDSESYDVIVKSLEGSRAEVAVPGIIKTLFEKFKNGSRIWTKQVLVERLWHSFQIQGYIDTNSHFPSELFASDSDLKQGYITQVILEEIRKHSLTPAKTKGQRKEAMLEAYRQVDNELIKRIHDVYAEDFSAFQYN